MKYGAAIAGFFGATVYLWAAPMMKPIRMLAALITGVLCAAYITPAVSEAMALSPHVENGAAFGIGLVAMSVVPGILRAVETIAGDPIAAWKKWKSGGG